MGDWYGQQIRRTGGYGSGSGANAAMYASLLEGFMQGMKEHRDRKERQGERDRAYELHKRQIDISEQEHKTRQEELKDHREEVRRQQILAKKDDATKLATKDYQESFTKSSGLPFGQDSAFVQEGMMPTTPTWYPEVTADQAKAGGEAAYGLQPGMLSDTQLAPPSHWMRGQDRMDARDAATDAERAQNNQEQADREARMTAQWNASHALATEANSRAATAFNERVPPSSKQDPTIAKANAAWSSRVIKMRDDLRRARTASPKTADPRFYDATGQFSEPLYWAAMEQSLPDTDPDRIVVGYLRSPTNPKAELLKQGYVAKIVGISSQPSPASPKPGMSSEEARKAGGKRFQRPDGSIYVKMPDGTMYEDDGKGD